MNVSRRVRTGGALGHLLLVVVLAVSVFVMHTVGHHDDSSSAGMSSASHVSAAVMDEGQAAHEPGWAAIPTDAVRATTPDDTPSTREPVMAMDMLSLCVAVLLSAWLLAALLRSALGRRPDWLASLRAQLPVALRAIPLPRGPDLTQLSVLRL
ncbi:hypothetical protein [Streptomyces regalis]|uniref:Uncharacterized protein n=1 Tax=Streptomyces regalis TaxID=68262 RepID=A0A0X3VRF5_9ACTN|nr:hypothetical protein [Streptomyces regalis]KUL46997.1 hypothetical protein ADL12_00705 [Streptomyces regalis]